MSSRYTLSSFIQHFLSRHFVLHAPLTPGLHVPPFLLTSAQKYSWFMLNTNLSCKAVNRKKKQGSIISWSKTRILWAYCHISAGNDNTRFLFISLTVKLHISSLWQHAVLIVQVWPCSSIVFNAPIFDFTTHQTFVAILRAVQVLYQLK